MVGRTTRKTSGSSNRSGPLLSEFLVDNDVLLPIEREWFDESLSVGIFAIDGRYDNRVTIDYQKF